MHDTHWTAFGAVTAFNAIVEADSRPDWKLDPARVLGAPETLVGGDLARLLGTADAVKETDRLLTLPSGKREPLDDRKQFATALSTSDRSGPTIMIIGDLFTEGFFVPMLLQNTGRVVWLLNDLCRFDWKWIDQLRPDEVWWMPTERYIVCGKGVRPVGLPPLHVRRTAMIPRQTCRRRRLQKCAKRNAPGQHKLWDIMFVPSRRRRPLAVLIAHVASLPPILGAAFSVLAGLTIACRRLDIRRQAVSSIEARSLAPTPTFPKTSPRGAISQDKRMPICAITSVCAKSFSKLTASS